MPEKKSTVPTLIERLMVFVDGGYLRALAKRFSGSDQIRWIPLRDFFIDKFNELAEPSYANLMRIYYYDGLVAPGDKESKTQTKYFDQIKNRKQFTVRLGDAVRDGKGNLKQKGVDILMAIDVLSKAYENHFNVAMFLAGDRDFLPLIRAVKDAGKKVFGLYYKDTAPHDVRVEYDVRHSLTSDDFRRFLVKKIKV